MTGRSIMHVLAPSGFGGLERVVHLLATAQHAAGNRVIVAAIVDQEADDPPLLDILRHDGIVVHRVSLPSRAYISQARALITIARTERPDIVHSHGYVPDVLLALSRRYFASKLVASVHGFTGGDRKNRTYEWLQRKALTRFDAVVAVSETLGRLLVDAGIRNERVHAIPNAYPMVRKLRDRGSARGVLGVPDAVFSIGWVGRISREKGLDVLIEALPLLEVLNWRLTIIGDGRERATLEHRVAALRLAERVSWRGMLANAGELANAFDVLVISSRTEGTPMTLLEALAREVPVVTTAVGGIPDVVSRNEAVLVPSEDTRALAAGIIGVAHDTLAAAERARRALDRVRTRFGMDQMVRRYDEVYNHVL